MTGLSMYIADHFLIIIKVTNTMEYGTVGVQSTFTVDVLNMSVKLLHVHIMGKDASFSRPLPLIVRDHYDVPVSQQRGMKFEEKLENESSGGNWGSFPINQALITCLVLS